MTGAVVEAGGVNNSTSGTPTDTGDLNSTDVDNPNDLWVPVDTPLRSQFGTYTLTDGRRLDLHAGRRQSRRAGTQ